MNKPLLKLGLDVCTDPTAPFFGCSAALLVFGLSFPDNAAGKVNAYAGVDYYVPISLIRIE